MKKTITTFLLSDNPNGIKSVWVENRICNCTYMTRQDLKLAKERDELNKPALYFLLGGDENQIYIGETEDFNKRIINHNNDKDFWNEALVFTAKDNSLSKSEVQYLEILAIQKAKQMNNTVIENTNVNMSFPSLPENRIEIVKDFFEEIIFLSSFLNYNTFEEYIIKEETNTSDTKENIETHTPNEQEYWYCKSKNGTDAKAIYTGRTMVVLAGSKICKESKDSLSKGDSKRKEIILKYAEKKDNYYILTRNEEFTSLSAASSVCLGSSSNGWISWCNESKQTLDVVYRTQ